MCFYFFNTNNDAHSKLQVFNPSMHHYKWNVTAAQKRAVGGGRIGGKY